jgi:hypothetical protein
MTQTTDSTAAIYAMIRDRLLNFAPLSGSKLLDSLSDLWVVQAPDTAAFPYGTLRFINTIRDGAYGGYRQTMDVELLLHASPRDQQAALEGYADIADEALLGWRQADSGLAFSFEGMRLSLPPAPPPADIEVCTIRLTYPVVVWPAFLAQYANQS